MEVSLKLVGRVRDAAVTRQVNEKASWPAARINPWSHYRRRHSEGAEDTLQRSLSHDFQSRIDALYRELDEASSEDLLRTLHSSGA